MIRQVENKPTVYPDYLSPFRGQTESSTPEMSLIISVVQQVKVEAGRGSVNRKGC